jgi:hypothetical protein|tara:strand:+ start:49 stop:243 length:195 start_codon:yes stop_codon:yes gene_type:complete
MTIQERMQMQLDKQDRQISDLYKDVREIKNMNLKFMSMGKGLLIGFAVMVASDFGIAELIMRVI